MKTGYLHTPNGASVAKIQDLLPRMTAEKFVSLAEQQAREGAANERLAQILQADAEKQAARLAKEQQERSQLEEERAEYIFLPNAQRKSKQYRRHVANRRAERVSAETRRASDTMARLTEILQTVIDGATAADSPCEKALPGGLHIHVRKDGGSLVLTIWRAQVPPSAREWNTVVAYWPWDIGPVNWSQDGVSPSGKFYKQARVPAR